MLYFTLVYISELEVSICIKTIYSIIVSLGIHMSSTRPPETTFLYNGQKERQNRLNNYGVIPTQVFRRPIIRLYVKKLTFKVFSNKFTAMKKLLSVILGIDAYALFKYAHVFELL